MLRAVIRHTSKPRPVVRQKGQRRGVPGRSVLVGPGEPGRAAVSPALAPGATPLAGCGLAAPMRPRRGKEARRRLLCGRGSGRAGPVLARATWTALSVPSARCPDDSPAVKVPGTVGAIVPVHGDEGWLLAAGRDFVHLSPDGSLSPVSPGRPGRDADERWRLRSAGPVLGRHAG